MVENFFRFMSEDLKSDAEKFLAERKKSFYEIVLPPVDMYESDNNLYIVLDLPGIKKESIQVEITSSFVTVSARRESEIGDKAIVHVNQRPERYFKRILLPTTVDKDKASSKYENGVLTITIPLGKSTKVPVE